MDIITKRTIDTIREIEDSLSSTVKISHHEVTKLVVIDLITKRNFVYDRNNDDEWLIHFDKILSYYIDEDEFQKYVINREPVE